MIVLNVYYKAKPGLRQEFYEKVSAADVPRLSREEEGNLGYEYFFSESDEDTLLLIEHWRDDEAFDFHTIQEHFKKLQRIKEDYMADVKIERFEVKEELPL